MGDTVALRRLERKERVTAIQERAALRECHQLKGALAQERTTRKALQLCGDRIEQLRGKAGGICSKTRDFLTRLEEARDVVDTKELGLHKALSQKVIRHQSIEHRVVELGIQRSKEKQKISEALEQEQIDEITSRKDSGGESSVLTSVFTAQSTFLHAPSCQTHSLEKTIEQSAPWYSTDGRTQQPICHAVSVETGLGSLSVEMMEFNVNSIRVSSEVVIAPHTSALRDRVNAKSEEITKRLIDVGVSALTIMKHPKEER